MPPEFQAWLTSAVGWGRFWLLPRLGSALLIALVTFLLIRWVEGQWVSWLRPLLLGARDRSPSQAVWRQVRLLALPRTLTRLFLILAAAWLIAERFQVPREVIFGLLLLALITTLWVMRHLFTDLAAGYALIMDDVLSEGDWLSCSLGEGTVERITWFAVQLRTNDGTQLIVPHRALRGTVLKVRRQAPNLQPSRVIANRE